MHNCTHWLRPRNSPASPPPLGSYTSALLVSQDRRHLFVSPCPSKSILLHLGVSPHCLEGPQQNEAQLLLKPKQNQGTYRYLFNFNILCTGTFILKNWKWRSFLALLRFRIRIIWPDLDSHVKFMNPGQDPIYNEPFYLYYSHFKLIYLRRNTVNFR